MKPHARFLLFVGMVVAGLATAALAATDPSLWWHVMGGGGGRSTSASYGVHGTIGQPAVAVSSGSGFRVSGGFWQRHAVAPPTPAPGVTPGTTPSAGPTDAVTPTASSTDAVATITPTTPSSGTPVVTAAPSATGRATVGVTATAGSQPPAPVYLPVTRKRR